MSLSVNATEGMWIPSMIQSLVGDDMQSMGMKISPEELYCINESCIRDAVVHFGGGCTSVLVSDQGLLLTNHHCGYSRIQSHSSLENNYLEDGFWAMSPQDELPNPGLDATIIKRIEDVTQELLKDLPENATEQERATHITARAEALISDATINTHYQAYIKPFYFGNQFLMFITEVFTDVRLVGAPPSSIGKYGFDTDNWVWPRHTGDFSVFRIYAGPNNEPADYSEDNHPYLPAHFLPVNISGVEKDDFTLVYGFPGHTDNYIVSDEVEEVLDVINPLRLELRQSSLSVIDQAMRADPLVKIQYAAKQSRISNAYKKWIGQSKGLTRHHAIERKDSVEQLFTSRISENAQWKSQYGTLLSELGALQDEMLPNTIGRQYFIEFYYVGPESMRFSEGFLELVNLCKDETKTDEEVEEWVQDRLGKMGFFKNYSAQIDKDIMKLQLPIVRADVRTQLGIDIAPAAAKYEADLGQYCDDIYNKSIFTDQVRLTAFLSKFKRKHYKKIEADPIYTLGQAMRDLYYQNVRDELVVQAARKDSLMRIWMAAQMEVLPEKTYYPDANGTLRISFGKVEGYDPFDAASYGFYTTLEGVMEKEDPTNPEYILPEKLKELFDAKDYGRYAHSNGEMRVCFIASNHTSGGNSGSPVIDANGNLIGLNFDRTWESTMSDIMFNPQICRNITVDIRYVLFIMDKFAGASHLVNEMTLVN